MATMALREARAKLLMPGPEPCCDRPMRFTDFQHDRDGLVVAAVFRCGEHRTVWTVEDEQRRDDEAYE